MQPVEIPGVGVVHFPDNMSDAQIGRVIEDQIIPQHQAAQKEHEKKTGFIPAVKSGWHEAKGAAEQALGELSGNQSLKDWGAEALTKAQTEHEATTDEDVANAKGFLPTAGKMFTKNISEPLGGILGSYGAPIAAGAVATALAPEALVGGAGLGAVEGLTGEAATAAAAQLAKREAAKRLVGAAATTAAAAPAEMGRNLQAQEAAHPGAAHDLTAAALMSIPEAAIVGFGMPGTKFINRLVPELMPVAQKLVPEIESGAITADAAKEQLASKAMQYGKAMAANTAAGTGMMIGTEDLRRLQAGQDMMSGAEMAQTAKTAALLSPIFAAFHGSDRAAAHEILTAAENKRNAELEKNQIDTHGGTETQVAEADAQRQADLEGLHEVNKVFNVARDKAENNKRIVANIIAEGDLDQRTRNAIDEHPDVKALDTLKGSQDFLKGLKENKDYTEEEKTKLRPQLIQYINSLKQKDTVVKKLTPEQQDMAAVFDAHQSLREAGLDTAADLEAHPLDKLHVIKSVVDEQAADPSLNKHEQKKYDYLTKWVDDAIANHPETKRAKADAEFNKVLELKRAKEAELVAQRQAQTAEGIAANEERIRMEAMRTNESRRAYLAEQERQRALAEKQRTDTEAYQAEQLRREQAGEEPLPAQLNSEKITQLGETLPEGINRDDFRAQQLAEEQRYKEEHQQAQADAFYLARQKPEKGTAKEYDESLVDELARREEMARREAQGLPTIEGEQLDETVPKGQGNLFTPKTGKPAAEAMRGNENTAPSNSVERPGSKPGVEVPSEQQSAANTKAGGAGAGTLGDAARLSGRDTGRVQENVAPEKTTLREAITARKNAIFEIARLMHKHEIKLPEELHDTLQELNEAKPDARNFNDWEANVEARVKEARDIIDSKVNKEQKTRAEKPKAIKGDKTKLSPELEKEIKEAEALAETESEKETADKRIHKVETLESKRRKGEAKPKEAKEATSQEELHKTIRDWFNPVWLNRALKNGWIKIHDSIADTDLSDEQKAKYDNSKALFFGKDGSIYFFTNNIPKGNELGVILHEIGEHKGLDNLIGKDRVTALANRIRAMAEGKKGKLDTVIAQKALKAIEGIEGAKSDKELIAYFAEIAVNEHKMRPGGAKNVEANGTLEWIKTLWSSIKDALIKLHFNVDDLNAQHVVDLVHGAARLEMGREGEMGPRQSETVSEAKGGPKLAPSEEATMRANGLTVFKQKEDPSYKTQVANVMNPKTGLFRGWLDTYGNKLVGPLFTAHRKANEYYGPDSFYTKATNKIRGTLLMQHTLNSMNFVVSALDQGYLKITDRGYFDTGIDKANNIHTLFDKWLSIDKRMKADGMSDAMIIQAKKTMAYADRYKELKALGIKTDVEFTDKSYQWGKDLQKKYDTEYKEWRDMYNKMRENNRETLIRSGLKTAKDADEWLKRAEYLPLYRITDDNAMDAVFMSNLTSAIREQKLGFKTEDFDVGDPMENIVKNQMWLTQRMMRNHTALRMADEFSEMGTGRWVKGGQANGKNTFAILKDGKVEHFQVDDPNDAAVFISAPVFHSEGLKLARLVAGTLRRTVTITPSFAYRQMWDDAERTWMQSGGTHSFAETVINSIKSQSSNLLKDSAKAEELARHGIVGQVDMQEGFERKLAHLMGTHNDTWLGKAETLLEKAERVARNSDLAARQTVYDSVIAQGKAAGRTDLDVLQKEAALRAQMMINFNHKGTSAFMRMMLSTVPFINARIQSDWRLVDALKGNIPGVSKEQAHKMLAMKVAKMATFTTLYSMANSSDDVNDQYEKVSDEIRNRNFVFPVGGEVLKVPVAPEYLVMKAAAEHSYRLLSDNEFEDGAKARKAIGAGLRNMIIAPTDMMPTFVTPLLENLTNHSFFTDRPLVSPTLQGLPGPMQRTEGSVSAAAQYISDLAKDTMNYDMSPIKIDNVLKGTFGTAGQDAMYVANWINEGITGVERPSSKLNQIPEVGALFADPEGSQRKNDFYTLRDQITPVHNALLKLRTEDPAKAAEYQKEHAVELRHAPQVNAIETLIANNRKTAQRIKLSTTMSGPEKLDALNALASRESAQVGTRVQMIKKAMAAEQE